MSVLLAAVRFEFSRIITAGRITWWFVLAGFPILIAGLIRLFPLAEAGKEFDSHQVWSVAIYLLVPCITCAMGVLLSAGSAIATELEQRSWVYLAVRPNGIFWLLLGKYLVAIVWSSTAAIAGLTIAVLFTGQDTILRMWTGTAALCVLSSMSYAAVFLLIGAIAPRRSMLFCVVWTAGVEGLISLIPAIINRMTIQYRLRALFVDWVQPGDEIQNNPLFAMSLADGPWYFQILCLLALTSIYLTVAQVIAHQREFTGAAESDV
ncbi:MAG: hypothetical protein MK110_18915 [Fuerstiella sp.]|nr:hypothetical protein [Fuerstiella sp.]